MRYGEESGGTSGFRVLISSVMSRLAIFYPSSCSPLVYSCIYLAQKDRVYRLPSIPHVQGTFYFRDDLGVSCQS